MPARDLPVRPNLDQLKHQAKDLLRALRDTEPSAKLADAQLQLARSYGASSWSRLVVILRLIDALHHDDVDAAREILLAHPRLADDYRTTRGSGWGPAMAEAASHGLRHVIAMLRERGARSAAAALARPELRSLVDMLRLLGGVGARPPKDVVGGAVEVLQGADFAFMAGLGADFVPDMSLVALALETYARNPDGKHRILETMAGSGVALPDTPPMAVHRGRIDLLAERLGRDPLLLERIFTHREIFPSGLGCHEDESLALVGVPLGGATLLHMAADYEEIDVVRWLLDRGMSPNVRAQIDEEGIGGQTALFNCVVTYNAGRRDASIARLLLDRGGDPNLRASIRTVLPFARDTSVHEYRDVTALGWGRRFHDQSYVSQPAMRVIEERGGVE